MIQKDPKNIDQKQEKNWFFGISSFSVISESTEKLESIYLQNQPF